MNRVFLLVELVVAVTVLSIVALSIFGLYSALVKSALYTKRKAVALTLATNQMEYLKSLSYDALAVSGGSIYATTYLPSSTTQVINGVTYTIRTKIDFVDDAYDGCGSYSTTAQKQAECRNYPPPAAAVATDLNPADYKIIHVSVYAPTTTKLAEVDTQISARVAETASTTGALFVTVIDSNGNPISGATISVTNTTLTPNVSLGDSTDVSGISIFYNLPPDSSGYDYTITASYPNYSTLTTIIPSGTLIPNYPSQKVLTQQSSFVTLTLKPIGTFGLLAEATDTNNAPITTGVKLYVKGGYKKYTISSNTAYYHDNLSPTDFRPLTDSAGLAAIPVASGAPASYNLVPGTYIFCGDAGATSCTNTSGSTTYYVAAAVPYGGTNSFNPVIVPNYLSSSPPSTTYTYNGNAYLQKVRLMLSTSSSFPRVSTLSPSEVDISSSNLTAFAFQVTGTNLPCSSTAASCSTSVKFVQGSNTYTASCTGASTGLQLTCTVNLTGITTGIVPMTVKVGTNTLTMPGSPLLGGFNVVP